MISTTFECLPVDVLFEIFAYLSPVNIVKSFLPLNKHFSRTILCEYLWHIDIGDNLTSLSIFNQLCQDVLKLIGARIVSLRLRLNNVINGWSLVSSSLRFHKSRLLRHLHLINITADEFNKLLHSHLIKELYTLTLDEVDPDLKDQPMEGAYLAKIRIFMMTMSVMLYRKLPAAIDYRLLGRLSRLIPFALKERPKVIIKERNNWMSNSNDYCCIIYTIPFNERNLSTYLLSKDLSKCCPMSINEVDLFPYADELFLEGYYDKDCFFELNNCKSSISLLVPWPLLTKISFDEGVVVSVHELELILRKAYNVRTLHIYSGNENLSRSILRNTDGVGTRINEQIESFILDDYTLTLRNAHDFCTVLLNRLPNLKKISFSIYDSINEWDRILSRIVNGENKATKRIREVIHFLVDYFKQLVFIEINLYNLTFSHTHCFPHLIRRQIHQYPLSRPYRFQYSAPMIQIWL
ncbi:unnamed protein product [Adineta steineri]|uniref:F-box domain-containing protein n=1 Tax=Adineta steineri TaxID=433720 RepID=A0A814X9T8_9BILA|nr:unnamed protein product [Adineta steineri]